MSVFDEARQSFANMPLVLRWIDSQEKLMGAKLSSKVARVVLFSPNTQSERKLRKTLEIAECDEFIILIKTKNRPFDCEEAIRSFMNEYGNGKLDMIPMCEKSRIAEALHIGILFSYGAQNNEVRNDVEQLLLPRNPE